MAHKTKRLGDLGGGDFVVARVSKDGKLLLQKGPIPPSHHKVKVEVYPRYAVRAAPETAPTPLNAWTGVDAGGVRLVVVYSYLAMMPAEVLCLLCPQVGRCKLELSSDDMTATFSTLISAGLPPNQLRGLMPNEVRANRGDFFKAFMHTLVTLDPDKRSAMLDGCQDLFVSVMTLHPGTEAARVAQQELVIRNQRENLMIGCLTPTFFEPWDRQHTQKHQWPDVLRPDITVTTAGKMDWYGAKVTKKPKLQNQRPTAGTVFVVAAFGRVPNRHSTLFMAMEVRPLSAGQGSTLVHDEHRGDDKLKCRVMVVFTVEDDPSVHPLQRFAAVGEEIATTLAKTNMASKGPFQPTTVATSDSIQAAARMVKEQYEFFGEGVVFKWARWSRPPYHFERGARVTMRAILADLAAHVCDTVPSANAAELVLRAIHSEEDVTTQNAGAALLLGKEIFAYLLGKLKAEAKRQDDADLDADFSCARWGSAFYDSFLKLVRRLYKRDRLKYKELEEAMVEHTLEEVASACGVDLFPTTMLDPAKEPIDPRFIHFSTGRRRKPTSNEDAASQMLPPKQARIEAAPLQ